MNIYINGSGAVKVIAPIPEEILSGTYPYLTTVEPSPDDGIWFSFSPYPEVFSETYLIGFLKQLLPYIDTGKFECCMSFQEGYRHNTLPEYRWSYVLIGKQWYRYQNGTYTHL